MGAGLTIQIIGSPLVISQCEWDWIGAGSGLNVRRNGVRQARNATKASLKTREGMQLSRDELLLT